MPKYILKKIRLILVNIILIIFTLLITITVVEIVLSFFKSNPLTIKWKKTGLFQQDKDLIWSLKSHENRILETDEFVEHATTNEYGIRDTEIKNRNVIEKRIIIMGDSMTFGHGVDNDKSFPNQLEKIYNDHHKNIDVINCGVKGYGSDQSYKFFLTRARNLSPDLLIFTIYTNDIFDNMSYPLYTIKNKSLIPLDPIKNWFYRIADIDQKMPNFIKNMKIYGYFWNSYVNINHFFSSIPISSKEKWAKEKLYLEIENLQKIVEKNNFKLLIVYLPYDEKFLPYYYKGKRDQFYSSLDKVNGVLYFEPGIEPVWKEKKKKLFYIKDSHFTSDGNKLLAERLYEFINDNNLL